MCMLKPWFLSTRTCLASKNVSECLSLCPAMQSPQIDRCLLGKAPVYLSNCCIPVSQVASQWHLRSAARHQLTIPRHLSTYGRRAFAVTGLTMFNTLPDDLRDPAVSTSTFRQSLKTHLFSAYQHV